MLVYTGTRTEGQKNFAAPNLNLLTIDKNVIRNDIYVYIQGTLVIVVGFFFHN